MVTSGQQLLHYIKSLDPLFGIPLVLGGAVMLTFGWRLRRATIGLSFALLGYCLGLTFAPKADMAMWYGLGAGGVLVLMAFVPLRFSVAVLGGAIGGYICYLTGQAWGLMALPLAILAVVCALLLGGLSAIYRQFVLILITSVEGAVLLVAGLSVVLLTSTNLHATVREMIGSSSIVLPFFIIVPAVMGIFYQVSEVRRVGAEL